MSALLDFQSLNFIQRLLCISGWLSPSGRVLNVQDLYCGSLFTEASSLQPTQMHSTNTSLGTYCTTLHLPHMYCDTRWEVLTTPCILTLHWPLLAPTADCTERNTQKNQRMPEKPDLHLHMPYTSTCFMHNEKAIVNT